MGPLAGYTIIEMAGIGPCPMAGMLFADMGANVIRVERTNTKQSRHAYDISARGKKSIALDLKQPAGKSVLIRLITKADALIEGFRPGVMEKLGLGPEECFSHNPALIFGRMTGWGQTGPLAKTAGHDINYIALTGALHAMGRKDSPPSPPLNLVGDFGGGAMFLVTGVLAALLESKQSGLGQVVDAAMVDGTANLMWIGHSLAASNRWDVKQREANLLDGGAFFYDTYTTADNKFVAIGSIEGHFFQEFVEKAGLDAAVFSIDAQMDQAQWPRLKQSLRDHIKTKSRQEWCDIFANSDACVAPVLTLDEAPEHPHNKARATYQQVDGLQQPSPAPRFGRTSSAIQHGQHAPGEDSREILQEFGFKSAEIESFIADGVVDEPQ